MFPVVEYGARYSTWLMRCSDSSIPSVPPPLGHSVPWFTGLRGSPSMWMGLPCLAYTSCAQPTAQNGQIQVPTRSACSNRGRNVRDVRLLAASAITLWPASCRGRDQSSMKPATRSRKERRMRFMHRTPAPPSTIPGENVHHNSARPFRFRSLPSPVRRHAVHGRDGDHCSGGAIPTVGRQGVGHQFMLRYNSSVEPDQLPPLLHRQVRVCFRPATAAHHHRTRRGAYRSAGGLTMEMHPRVLDYAGIRPRWRHR